MFAYIKGILSQVASTYAIIETAGIGYKIFIPVNVLNRLPNVGSSLTLHLSFVVREQAQTLYGFLATHERDFFESLMGVTGIGPKLALALIGHMNLTELQTAIRQEDIKAICRVPGIGKKGAERLIIEMRDKISSHMLPAAADSPMQLVNDAMSALLNLGYNQATAQKAIQKSLQHVPEGIDLAALIGNALKHV